MLNGKWLHLCEVILMFSPLILIKSSYCTLKLLSCQAYKQHLFYLHYKLVPGIGKHLFLDDSDAYQVQKILIRKSLNGMCRN